MLRFVLLRHECPLSFGQPSHWDLMLERDGVLLTWRLDSLRFEEPVAATKLADHRLAYLEFEGPLTGDRGSVARCDAGDYSLVAESPQALQLDFTGNLLAGNFTLTQIVGDQWRLQKQPP